MTRSALSFLALLVACASPPDDPVGERPPELEVSLHPKEDLQALLTTPPEGIQVVNFWATWCGPCRAELPELHQLAVAHPEVRVVLVSLDLPQLRATHVTRALEDLGLAPRDNLELWILDTPDPGSALRAAWPTWGDVVPLTLAFGGPEQAPRVYERAVTRSALESDLQSAGWLESSPSR